jgi:hypothetical protein
MDSILLGKTKHRGARNETNNVPIHVETTSKPAIVKDIKASVDLYDVYMDEYSNCDKFRVTLTIKPYCTNILFNVCTEVVKNEGDEDCFPVSDTDPAPQASISGTVYGRSSNLYRNYMVSNTEYSSPEIGYEYLPGYDIFANHTLRNLSFRPVMKVANSTNASRNVFNTLADLMRDENGNVIDFYPRFSLESIENSSKSKMHIYEHSNLLGFIDGSSFDANLVCENGWYGFTNNSIIDSEPNQNEGKKEALGYSTHEFSHTINNYGNCDFVDMFPDRKRFSFVPMYNRFRHRYEKNWDVFLTYPWKNFYNHNLVRNLKRFDGVGGFAGNGKTYALATMRTQWTKFANNRYGFLFRVFSKHGLSINDKVAIYLSRNAGQSYERMAHAYKVDYLGDTDGSHTAYFFGITSKTLLNDIFAGRIEYLFYTKNDIEIKPETRYYTVSNEITEVPFQPSYDIIYVYYYTIDTNPSAIYDDNTTFDSKPKTVNSASEPFIRVWNGEYDYMTWDDTQEQYVSASINTSIDYGVWNTFTDIPTQFVKDCIRVKQYYKYKLEYDTYQMKRNLREGTDSISDIINQDFINHWHIRFTKIVSDVECKYYIRQFRKIPNLKYSEEKLPDGITTNHEAYEKFLSENATESDGSMIEFDSETYKLAFSKTIYGDDVAQVTFLDNVEIGKLVDNLGRPLTEIYSTIVKRNSGYRLWYANMGSDYGHLEDESDKIEYSRCFGSVTTGFDYLDLDDVFDRKNETRKLKGMMSSVTSLYRDENETGDIPMSLEDWDTENIQKEIVGSDNVFFGDLVEYNPVQCKETVLSEACFRFNTAQREIGDDTEHGDFDFTYTELIHDDFDPIEVGKLVPFETTTYKQWLQRDGEETLDVANVISVRKHEGYFYKPHTKIPLFKFSDTVEQGSHRTLRIKDCKPIQSESLLLKVSTITMHGVPSSNTVFLCDGENWYTTKVSYVIDNYTFTVVPISKMETERNGLPYVDWVTTCEKIKSGEMKVRVCNENIPSYASRIGENLFMWRNVVNPVTLPEDDKYRHPFSNNAFYVDAIANVYLRRQDAFGINGLTKGETGDIDGNPHVETDNSYKPEKDIVCY